MNKLDDLKKNFIVDEAANESSAERVEIGKLENKQQKLKKTKTGASESEAGSAVSALVRQVEIKRKYLDHVIQVLNQTLSYLLSSLASSAHLIDVSSANNSSNNSPNSSAVSSVTSSPVHVTETTIGK